MNKFKNFSKKYISDNKNTLPIIWFLISIFFITFFFGYLLYQYFNIFNFPPKNYFDLIFFASILLFILFVYFAILFSKFFLKKSSILIILILISYSLGSFLHLLNPKSLNENVNSQLTNLKIILMNQIFDKKIVFNSKIKNTTYSKALLINDFTNEIILINLKKNEFKNFLNLDQIKFENNIPYTTEKLSYLSYIMNVRDNIYFLSTTESKKHKPIFFDYKTKKIIKELNVISHHWHDIDNINNQIAVLTTENHEANYEEKDLFKEIYKKTSLLSCGYNKIIDKELKNIVFLEAINFYDTNNFELKKKFFPFFEIAKHENLKNYFENCYDPMHINNIYILKDNDNKKFKIANNGDFLVTIREMDSIVLFSRKTFKINFFFYGNLNRPHSAIVNKDGNIVVFDNLGTDINGKTRIVEIDPETKEIIGIFNGTKKYNLNAITRGQVLEIDKNNYLIVDNNDGKVFNLDCSFKKKINNLCKFNLFLESPNAISTLNLLN